MKWLITLVYFVLSFALTPIAHAEELVLKKYILPSGLIYMDWVSPTMEWLNQEAVKFSKPYIIQALVPKAEAEEVSLKEAINRYIEVLANKLDISASRVKKLVQCESGYNERAFNPKDTDGKAKYGLLQWLPATYHGAGGKDLYDWKENLEVGMPLMAKGKWKLWPTCSK